MLAKQWLMETWVIRNLTCHAPIPIHHRWQCLGTVRQWDPSRMHRQGEEKSEGETMEKGKEKNYTW